MSASRAHGGEPARKEERRLKLGPAHAVERGDVDRTPQLLVQQGVAHRGAGIHGDVALGLHGRGPEVRREDHVGRLPQGMIRRQGLHLVDVEHRSTDPSLLERLDQRLLIDDPATGEVHHQGGRAKPGQGLSADQAAGLGGERRVDSEDVRRGEQDVERERPLDLQRLQSGVGDVGVEGDHSHPEGPRPQRHFTPDRPEAHDAEGATVQFPADELVPFPLAPLHRGVGGGEMPEQRKHRSEKEFGHRHGVPGRGVDHGDAEGGGGLQRDVVDPHPGTPDHLEAGAATDHLFGDLGGAPDDDRIVVGDPLQQVGRRQGRRDVHLEPRFGAEEVDPFLIDPVGDEDAE